MIKNERQYKITKTSARKFSEALKSNSLPASKVDPIVAQASLAAIASQLAELEHQITEYEALKSGSLKVLEVESLHLLPETLIKARIAAGLSQRDLGSRLGLKEQQIQRYEETNYAGASLARLIEVSRALNLNIKHETMLGANPVNVERLLDRLTGVGLARKLVLSRFLPRNLVTAFTADPAAAASNLASELVSTIKRIFGWSNSELLGNAPLSVESAAVATARFKLRGGRNEQRVSAYTVYAHYLAMLVLKGIEHIPARALPESAQDFYDNVCLEYEDMTLANALRYMWSLGIAILPLDDDGAFDGAYWRVNGRHVIVLKQNSGSSARWLFDLLHDYCHAIQHPEQMDSQVVELPPTSPERRDSKDERDASDFAGQVILAGHDEELIYACEQSTQGRLQNLKAALPGVAKKIGVDLAAAANFMAYKVSLNGENWWGAAANLQPRGESPWLLARNLLLERISFRDLSPPDRMLLVDALTERDRDHE